jgi:hypothetical protein
LISAGVGVAIADRAPRRPILVWGTLVCAVHRFRGSSSHSLLADVFGSQGMLAINAGLTRAWAFMDEDNKNLNVGRCACFSTSPSLRFVTLTHLPSQRRCRRLLLLQHYLLLCLHVRLLVAFVVSYRLTPRFATALSRPCTLSSASRPTPGPRVSLIKFWHSRAT